MGLRTILTALLAVSLGANGYLFYHLSAAQDRRPYFSSHEPLIERSIADYAARLNLPRDEAMGPRFAVAVRTADGICINLPLPEGYLGWTPVYCFSGDGALTYRGQV